ncbi:hypothetical protein [Sphingomonas melonis]|uniref:hypothetical protein n=1 Tax=Sphingomonas melonis TaxID=152682 RepID=UPI000870C041|nr:hypothetical protein [Sphingomonas melonis]AOW24839.1 hypothetical protein BJP26_15795 [Sphingomonas melonis TY]
MSAVGTTIRDGERVPQSLAEQDRSAAMVLMHQVTGHSCRCRRDLATLALGQQQLLDFRFVAEQAEQPVDRERDRLVDYISARDETQVFMASAMLDQPCVQALFDLRSIGRRDRIKGRQLGVIGWYVSQPFTPIARGRDNLSPRLLDLAVEVL